MTREELKKYDGRDGRSAYIAVSNVIYDVTASPSWNYGSHYGKHLAGCDLTEELKSAPHVRTVIERFPVIGQIGTDKSSQVNGRSLLMALLLSAISVAVILILIF